MNIHTVKIGEFLASLTDVDYQYLGITMQVKDGINTIIKELSLTKEEVCQHFQIKEDAYDNFVKGNYHYAISHMATSNYLFFKIRERKALENPPFKPAIDDQKGNY